MSNIPDVRRRVFVEADVRTDGDYVLYWMVATRRLNWNVALDRAIEIAEDLGKPLLVFEPLRVGYRWAADRHHQFLIDGMAHHRASLADTGVGYYAYVEPKDGAGKGLLAALAEHACAVVGDDSPTFFTPKILRAASGQIHTRFEVVDSCGLFPLRGTDKGHSAAYHFRRFLHKNLPEHLGDTPVADPIENASLPDFGGIPSSVAERPEWAPAWDVLADEDFWGSDPTALADEREPGRATLDLGSLDIDHAIEPTALRGGHGAARRRLDAFLEDGLDRYGEERNDPDSGAASGLSPWLHYGHIATHEIFDAVTDREGWTPQKITPPHDGRRKGWWGMSASAESFLDELITWRELGYGYCYHETDYESYDTLPEWARDTLETHSSDEREHVYSLEEFAAAETHDELWNAAQRQLVHEGIIHNYLRMLWGKKILEWTEHPRDAHDVMIELNNRYALDGRDPNSYSGIMWVLGRFDRGWPEREIYGKVRTMTSASTRRKVELARYLEKWGEQGAFV